MSRDREDDFCLYWDTFLYKQFESLVIQEKIDSNKPYFKQAVEAFGQQLNNNKELIWKQNQQFEKIKKSLKLG